MTQAIDIQDLTIEAGGQVLLRALTLAVSYGQKLVITGPSGSGKSTLLKCLLGFTRPSSGRILIQGKELTAATVWPLRRSLAYVGQEPDLGTGVVQQIIERPYAYRANHSVRCQLERLPEQLAQFNLTPDVLTKDITSLSGGEKQRVALASAVLLDRPIYLLDEVTSALDRSCKEAVLDFFLGQRDATVLLVSHDPDALQRADLIVELDQLSEGT